MLEALKGDGRSILACRTEQGRVELLAYADESYAIRVNDRVIGIWEHDEQDDCMELLARMMGIKENRDSLMILTLPPGGLNRANSLPLHQPPYMN